MQGLFSGITVVGEGHDGPESPPIDVHDNKLLGWLLERHKVTDKWQTELRAIKEKVKTAVAALPTDVDEITRLLNNNLEVHYFVCKRIFEQLEKIEPNDKTLFGQYTSPRLKAWHEIIKAYESGNVYLGEACQLLINYVKYEVPAAKRKLERCKKQIEDFSRKEVEQSKSCKEYIDKFYKSCEALGIEGKDVQKELESLVLVLPEIFAGIVKKLQENDTIEKACTFYATFLEYSLSAKEGSRKYESNEICSTLLYIYKHGNVPLREMLGIAEEEKKPENKEKEKESEITIDWGAISIEEGETPKEAGGLSIDWGIDVSGGGDAGATPPAIDWGDIPTAEEGAPTINWDIEVAEEGGGDSAIDLVEVQEAVSEHKEQGVPPEFKNASLSEGVLENSLLRNRFLNDLHELEFFLKQRLAEMTSTANIAMGDPTQLSAPVLIQQTTSEAVKKYLAAVQGIIALLQDKKLRQVLDIKSSKRLCVRLAASINQHMSVSNSMKGARVETERRRDEAQEQLKQAYPKVNQLAELTKGLKKDMEAALYTVFNKRVFNIIGEVNTI